MSASNKRRTGEEMTVYLGKTINDRGINDCEDSVMLCKECAGLRRRVCQRQRDGDNQSAIRRVGRRDFTVVQRDHFLRDCEADA